MRLIIQNIRLRNSKLLHKYHFWWYPNFIYKDIAELYIVDLYFNNGSSYKHLINRLTQHLRLRTTRVCNSVKYTRERYE